jgi:transcriptional regulator GlxA family with amidase domain
MTSVGAFSFSAAMDALMHCPDVLFRHEGDFKMKKVAIVAFDRFTDLDVFLPWDLMYRAKAAGADIDIKILGKTDHVTAVSGLKVPTHGRLDETKDSDIVIFASGIGIPEVLADQSFLDALALDEQKQLIGSMCGGSLILAAKGILEGKEATTYPTYFERLKMYKGVQPVERGFVACGNVATAGGCLSAQFLCGWLLERIGGKELANAVLATILPVGEGCKAFAGWGDPDAATAPASAAKAA